MVKRAWVALAAGVVVFVGIAPAASAKSRHCWIGCTQRTHGGVAVTLESVGQVGFHVAATGNTVAQGSGTSPPSSEEPPDGSSYLVLTVMLVNTSNRLQDLSLRVESFFSVDDGHGNKLTAAKAPPLHAPLPKPADVGALIANVETLSPGSNKFLTPEQSVQGALWYQAVPTKSHSLRLVYKAGPTEAMLIWRS
jgi:hypothetical protein